MPLRLLRTIVPRDDRERTLEILAERSVEPLSDRDVGDDHSLVESLIDAQGSEELLDDLEKAFGEREGFRMLLLPVEAAIPRRDKEEEKEPEGPDGGDVGEGEEGGPGPLPRVSREELYEDLAGTVVLNGTYLLLAALASVVATVGILGDDTPVIIGAMVIAPLLGPLVTLAFATTLADPDLARGAVVAGVAGTVLALAIAAGAGWLAPVDPSMPQIASRIRLGYGDLILALASGSAGVLSLTAGVAEAVVGVMVAVALLPPLVVAGLLLGAGFVPEAAQAFLAFVAYIIGINLAGVVTFLAQGVAPLSWWEADRARKATRWAIGIWIVLLVGLAGLVAWLRT